MIKGILRQNIKKGIPTNGKRKRCMNYELSTFFVPINNIKLDISNKGTFACCIIIKKSLCIQHLVQTAVS